MEPKTWYICISFAMFVIKNYLSGTEVKTLSYTEAVLLWRVSWNSVAPISPEYSWQLLLVTVTASDSEIARSLQFYIKSKIATPSHFAYGFSKKNVYYVTFY